jgi:hypothetical protein
MRAAPRSHSAKTRSPAAKSGAFASITSATAPPAITFPERAGSFTLAAPRFSYFDPAAGAYRTLTAPPIALAVQASTQPAAQPPVGAPAATPARAAAPETLGRDIVFIKDTPGALTPIGRRLYRSVTFWMLQLVPLALWAAVTTYDRRRKLLRADPRLARFASAGRSVRRAIAGAEAALRAGDRGTFTRVRCEGPFWIVRPVDNSG